MPERDRIPGNPNLPGDALARKHSAPECDETPYFPWHRQRCLNRSAPNPIIVQREAVDIVARSRDYKNRAVLSPMELRPRALVPCSSRSSRNLAGAAMDATTNRSLISLSAKRMDRPLSSPANNVEDCSFYSAPSVQASGKRKSICRQKQICSNLDSIETSYGPYCRTQRNPDAESE